MAQTRSAATSVLDIAFLESENAHLKRDVEMSSQKLVAAESKVAAAEKQFQALIDFVNKQTAAETERYNGTVVSIQSIIKAVEAVKANHKVTLETVESVKADIKVIQERHQAVPEVVAAAPSTSYKAALAQGSSKEINRVVKDATHRTFRVSGIAEGNTKESASQLTDKVKKAVSDSKMQLSISLVSIERVGRFEAKAESGVQRHRPIRITLATAQQAEAVVKERRKLKGAPLVIMDELTPQELAAQQPLWPLYKQARKDGQAAFFRRARLFVEVQEVKGPPS